MKAIHLKITGRVQGVFFRSSTKEKADALGITGWVKNCDDGSVEVLAQGEEEELNEFERWCEKGPPTADVECTQKEQSTFQNNIKDFRIT